MAERRGTIGAVLALLLTAGALVCVSGCAPRQARFEPNPTRTAAPTGAVVASETPTGAVSSAGEARPLANQVSSSAVLPVAPSGAAPTGAAGSSSASGLSAKDAAALDAELSAIQSELDRLSVPSDSDFDSIGSGLK
jgi:hypothetical protein